MMSSCQRKRNRGISLVFSVIAICGATCTSAFTASRWALESCTRNRIPIPSRQRQCGWAVFQSNIDNSESEQSSSSAFEDKVLSAIASGGRNAPDLMAAAAAVTRESSNLLGIKSIGVDFGLARTGLALNVGFDPQPLTILTDLNTTEVAQQVVHYSAIEQAKQIVVGLPLHKNGTEARQTTITRAFAAKLARHAMAKLGPNVPVVMFDERYTSKEAAARLHSENPNTGLSGMLDAEAACIILENYYKDNGEKAQLVILPDEVKAECLVVWEASKAEEDGRLQIIKEQREGNLRKRQEAMERARKLEAEMESNGMLGTSNKKKKKKKKKKREKRTWTTL